jgi:hypothetical protein
MPICDKYNTTLKHQLTKPAKYKIIEIERPEDIGKK